MSKFDVIVVGGGHAGTEAASAAARLGARTALVTHKAATIGAMSCNPAIGGLGKGHLVREIDALDGLMGRAIDAGGIQFRTLNASKGPAVQGPRAQADRRLYAEAVQALLADQDNLTILEGAVEDLIVDQGRCCGIVLGDGTEMRAGAVVLTTGTFLRGVIHRGATQIAAGRVGEAPSIGLARTLERLSLPLGRLKTGTPPRLDAGTIDWAGLEEQPGDDPPVPFSVLTERITTPQLPCHITWTNEAAHAAIRDNLDRAPLYSGQIEGTGPRYCPSIEDKVVRFADKPRHQIFLEPEGLDSDLIYPNGISTSLPEDVQLAMVRAIPGLERAEIRQFGYAIEYDFVDPRSLDAGLQLRALPGLWLAGQINGTTGYEEAAGQGLVAGLNAARAAGGRPEPASFDRAEAYLGVMIDDLVTRGAPEPYRMFTSRAEYRLHLRADNADQRLTDRGLALGLVGPERAANWLQTKKGLEMARAALQAIDATPNEIAALGIEARLDGRRRALFDWLRYPELTLEKLAARWPALAALDPAAAASVTVDARYAGYLTRQQADIEAYRKDEALALPRNLDYAAIGGLSTEIRETLARARPATLGAAGRLPGVTPAATLALLRFVKKRAERRAA